MRALVTAGGTREPLDGVRVLTNNSTGKTGALVADALFQAGWETTLLRAVGAIAPQQPVQQVAFSSVAELDRACHEQLSTLAFDLVVHAAAVSDFVVEAITVDGVRSPTPLTGKLSSASRLCVELVPGKKILPALKGYSRNPGLRLVGFKLTDGASASEVEQAVQRVLTAGADLVVHNDLQTMQLQRATLWFPDGRQTPALTEHDLIAALIGYAKALC